MTQELIAGRSEHSEPSPAVAFRDITFLKYARDCAYAVNNSGAVEKRIAALTKEFARTWRMPDERFLQLQPNAPYASYLLYLSESSDLSIVLDIFMAGQAAVAHNHLCWCVFCCLEGVERERLLKVPHDLSAAPSSIESRLRYPGEVTTADPGAQDFHEVECADSTRAVSLHIYGADIGRIKRQMWNGELKRYESFRSGYSNDLLNLPPYLAPRDLA